MGRVINARRYMLKSCRPHRDALGSRIFGVIINSQYSSWQSLVNSVKDQPDVVKERLMRAPGFGETSWERLKAYIETGEAKLTSILDEVPRQFKVFLSDADRKIVHKVLHDQIDFAMSERSARDLKRLAKKFSSKG